MNKLRTREKKYESLTEKEKERERQRERVKQLEEAIIETTSRASWLSHNCEKSNERIETIEQRLIRARMKKKTDKRRKNNNRQTDIQFA